MQRVCTKTIALANIERKLSVFVSGFSWDLNWVSLPNKNVRISQPMHKEMPMSHA